jgi:succinate dehydrogenase hydrophobic anchor subunit
MNENVLGTVIGLAIALVIVAILVVIFRWLWNSTLPDVFGVREVTFWQAFKIMLLASILFGGHRVVEVPQQVTVDDETTTAQSQ